MINENIRESSTSALKPAINSQIKTNPQIGTIETIR